jgi:hypothetical protein
MTVIAGKQIIGPTLAAPRMRFHNSLLHPSKDRLFLRGPYSLAILTIAPLYFHYGTKAGYCNLPKVVFQAARGDI